jgi:hypothetical protein
MAIQYEQLSFVFEPPEEDVDWTDELVEQLQAYVLKKSLSLLGDGRVCLKTRTECLDWLLDDSIHPFSFHVCCYAMDVNPLTLREKTIGFIKRKR